MRLQGFREPIRFAVVASVLAILLAAPVVGTAAAPKIIEELYISDPANKSVYILEATWKGKKAAKTELVETLTGFKNPTDVAVGGGFALVVDGKFVWSIDTATRQVLGKIKTGKDTRFVTVTEDGKFGFATQGKRFLRIIDLDQGKVIGKIKTGNTPWRVRVDHNGDFGAVVNVGDNSVTIFDLGVVLARQAESIDAPAARSTPGVRTIKAGVCDLSGGLDVARFGAFGTWAIWSCGDGPTKASRSAREPFAIPVSPAQQTNISDENARVLEYKIVDMTATTGVMWNPDCGTSFLEDGVSGTEGTLSTRDGGLENGLNLTANFLFDRRRDLEQRSFNYNWNVEKTVSLGSGRMANPFSRVDGGQLSLYHPKGIGQAKVGVWNAPDDGEISDVASTLTGVPAVCDR